MNKAYCESRQDGAGAVINEEIFVLAHCIKKNLEFVGAYGHNPHIQNHFQTHQALCEFLKLPLPFISLPPTYQDYIKIKETDYSSEVYPNMNQLLDDSFIQMLRSRLDKPQILDKPHAAVHVRRNDVKVGNPRYLPNSYYIGIIKKIKEINPNVRISVFSQSNSSEPFDEFAKLGCDLQLDKDLVFSWKEMIFADVLVMSKGSFSYVPALYNSNFVIFHPAWYQKLNHWHHVEDPNLWTNIKPYLINN